MGISAVNLVLLLLCGTFYRYLDLTPTMDLLPRGEITADIACNMICFQLTRVSRDTLAVVRLDRGVPTPVYNFPGGFSVVSSDSSITWISPDSEPSGYRMMLDENGLPALLSELDGSVFLEWAWENDSTVTVYSIDPLMGRVDTDLLPNYTGTAVRLDDNGDLEYFKYETLSASALQYTLNSFRRVLSKRMVSASGEIIPTSDGVAETRYTYDPAGNLTSTRLISIEGNLLPNDYSLPTTGNYSFDMHGIVENQVNIAYTVQSFDENCLYILERHYGVDGKPVENLQGVSSIVYQRELSGGVSESVWFDIHGHRTEIEGISVTRRTFDEQGRVTESSTYNADLEIADFPGGFAFTRFTYAEDGQPVLISYYDSSSEPVINSSLGCHSRSFVYDEEGRCIELRYLGISGSLVNLCTGYARVVSVFDQEGELVEHLFFDENGEEVQP
ncbi:MAG: hypothetical protein KAH54_04060 [Candidatus Sabulitectum sp.]|nr:hypothetical protein [Candidatus Sabulitectum sp.]